MMTTGLVTIHKTF